jgi:hypothetical protein
MKYFMDLFFSSNQISYLIQQIHLTLLFGTNQLKTRKNGNAHTIRIGLRKKRGEDEFLFRF